MLTQLNEQIAENKELSYIDALTGIKNRKAYDETVHNKKRRPGVQNMQRRVHCYSAEYQAVRQSQSN